MTLWNANWLLSLGLVWKLKIVLILDHFTWKIVRNYFLNATQQHLLLQHFTESVTTVTPRRTLPCGKVHFWSWKLCSAWQAKRSHLSPSQLTTKANRTSAEKTVHLTSARWAARPTADFSVCLWALRAGRMTKAVYLTKIGLHIKCSPVYSYTGKLTGMYVFFCLVHEYIVILLIFI